MKTLHFIYLNISFVSKHVVVSLKHDYHVFNADYDYAIFLQIPRLFMRPNLKNVFHALHVRRNRCFTYRFYTVKLSFAAQHR